MISTRAAYTVFLVLVITTGADCNFSGDVSNFQVVDQYDNNITFSWSLPDTLIYSINYFRIFYLPSSRTSSGYYSQIGFYPSSDNLFSYPSSNISTTYEYSITIASLSHYGEYLMGLRVYRDYNPNILFSKDIEVRVENSVYLEMKLKLRNGRTCSKLVDVYSVGEIEAQFSRAFRHQCECSYNYFSKIYFENSYIHCQTENFATFRIGIYSNRINIDAKLVVPVFRKWLQNSDSEAIIWLQNKELLVVETGPCGLTIPHLNAPYCGDFTLTEPAAITSDAVIIASTFGVLLVVIFLIILGALGYIIGRKRGLVCSQKPRAVDEQKNPVARFPVKPQSFRSPVQAKQQAVGNEYIQDAGELYTEMDL